MKIQRPRFALVAGLVGLVGAAGLVGGCGAKGSSGGGAGDGSGGGGGGKAAAASECPSIVFSDETCLGSELGVMCPGTAQCVCDGVPETTKASCTCQMHDGQPAWVCDAAACDARCGGGDPGSGGGSAGATCPDFVEAVMKCAGHPPVSADDAAAQCAMVEEMCGASFDDYLACFGRSMLTCQDGLPYVPGCDDQVDAFAACYGVMLPH